MSQVHVCKSCVSNVVQTFNHYQEQIVQLKRDKDGLQEELRQLIKDHEEQKRFLVEEIRVLEERLALLEKRSETDI